MNNLERFYFFFKEKLSLKFDRYAYIYILCPNNSMGRFNITFKSKLVIIVLNYT